MAKCERHVYPTGEIPHLWAHQTQHDARNQQGNLYFTGDRIYSYGPHFEIARFVTNSKGTRGILLNSRTYSVTTSRHQSAVRSAIPPDMPKFTVPDLDGHDTENLQYYRNEITRCVEQASRRRVEARATWDLKSAAHLQSKMRQYIKFWDLPDTDIPTVPELGKGTLQRLAGSGGEEGLE